MITRELRAQIRAEQRKAQLENRWQYADGIEWLLTLILTSAKPKPEAKPAAKKTAKKTAKKK